MVGGPERGCNVSTPNEDFVDFDSKADAKIWPGLSYVCHICSTTGGALPLYRWLFGGKELINYKTSMTMHKDFLRGFGGN